MAQLPKAGSVRGYDKPIRGSCAIYFPGGIFQWSLELLTGTFRSFFTGGVNLHQRPATLGFGEGNPATFKANVAMSPHCECTGNRGLKGFTDPCSLKGELKLEFEKTWLLGSSTPFCD